MSVSGQSPKYPSDALIAAWWLEGPEGCDISVYVARKACDWQREQDALICDSLAERSIHAAAQVASEKLADSIRSGASHD